MMYKNLLAAICIVSVGVSAVSAADVILNEYNAVSSSNSLDDGDSVLGSIQGNGGNWFELLVIGDHVDMRGWQLQWTEDEMVADNMTAAGTVTLSNHSTWSDLRSGSILTLIETANAGGGNINTDTDVSYDPAGGDWTINVATQSEVGKGDAALVTTVTNDGMPGDFSVGNRDWTLTILDSGGNTIFGPAGEGSPDWMGDGVGGSEGGSLEGPESLNGVPPSLAEWQGITPGSSLYDDTASTSFGAENVDFDDATMQFVTIQDLSALRAQLVMLGDGDLNGDGQLTAADIDELSAAVRDQLMDERFDMNLDGTVNGTDRTVWVEQIRRTFFGDANLDGEFNSDDLLEVFSAGEYADATDGNSTWATGDFDGDADFTPDDLIEALSGGGYEMGRRGVAAVPEPSTLSLLLLAMLALVRRRRR